MYFVLWVLWLRTTHRFLGFSWFTGEVCCLPRKVRCGETVRSLQHLVSTEVLYKVQLSYSHENYGRENQIWGPFSLTTNDGNARFQGQVYPQHCTYFNMGYLSPLTHFKKQKFNILLLQFKRKNMYFVSKWHLETSAIPGYQNMGYVFCLFTFLKYSRKFPKYWNSL